MILFREDFDRYPTAIVHHQTTNNSFLRLAQLYKNMGLKNYYFHLALHNPELVRIDPHSPNLTVDEMTMIGIECRTNPWYFFREVFKVPPVASANPFPFLANRGNIALFWCFFNHIDFFLIQPRQTGKSVSTDALSTFIIRIGAVNTTEVLLTKDNDLRKKNIERLKKMASFLPSYLLLEGDVKDADNKEEITCKALGNHYMTAISQNNELSSNNMGRGLTAPIIHCDEGPFINFMDVVVPALLTAGNAARQEAALTGNFFGNIFTTTAGKRETRSGKYMYSLLQGGMVMSEIALFDLKNSEQAAQVVRANSPGNKAIINATFSHRQLGYTDEWLVKSIQENNSTGDEADRDFFNQWSSGSLSSPLSVELSNLIKGSIVDPDHVEISKEGYILNWYIPKQSINNYMSKNKVVMGMDTSEAIGRDSITMVLIDVNTLETIAAGSCNETNLIRFSNYVADLMVRFRNIILIPERKSTGTTLIDSLLIRLPTEGIDPFKRIYNRVVDEATEYVSEYRDIQTDVSRRNISFYDRFKKHFGFNTSGSGKFSRHLLYSDVLQMAASRACTKVRDTRLANEILGLETKNGRIDHSSLGHDDMVIAWLLTVWMLAFSKNLRYYGLESIMKEAREYHLLKEELEPYDAYQVERQAKIRESINDLLEELKSTKDEMISMMIQKEIRNLNSKLTDIYSPEDSIDNLIQNVLSARKATFANKAKTSIDRNSWMNRR